MSVSSWRPRLVDAPLGHNFSDEFLWSTTYDAILGKIRKESTTRWKFSKISVGTFDFISDKYTRIKFSMSGKWFWLLLRPHAQILRHGSPKASGVLWVLHSHFHPVQGRLWIGKCAVQSANHRVQCRHPASKVASLNCRAKCLPRCVWKGQTPMCFCCWLLAGLHT